MLQLVSEQGEWMYMSEGIQLRWGSSAVQLHDIGVRVAEFGKEHPAECPIPNIVSLARYEGHPGAVHQGGLDAESATVQRHRYGGKRLPLTEGHPDGTVRGAVCCQCIGYLHSQPLESRGGEILREPVQRPQKRLQELA